MARTLLAIYPHSARRYDEMLTGDGNVRAHWRQFFIHLDSVAPEEMHQRLEFVDRRILENGVTYNVYADPNGADRPWALDPVPLIIPPDEWAEVSAAVAQRAALLNAMLADLYGEQRLLAEGLLPPALVYGQHGYLWPCQGIKPPGGTWLHHYAVDLARSPNGRWWVIADRTQAPSGAGYALENRLIVSRVFPEMFRDLNVQHLADFFRDQQDGLSSLAPTEGDETPHIVLLTPGPYNETYFEHAYLARYLGYPLVEGQDLTVRGDSVFLKTLRGLKRVHVILRRQDDDYCDPLELRGDSALGVPGLLNVVRAGRVVVANALGSGLLTSGALMGFLPGVCERLLGERLAMPSVATWWCGEKPALDYVKKHFDELVIKPAYPTQRMDPVFGFELEGDARAEMLRRIEARPHAYVAQEMVNLSQAPTWSRSHERRLIARPVGLRAYAVANADGGYSVMPGGLTRVAQGATARIISMQRGGASKDTWVLTDGPVSQFTLLKPSVGVRDLVRSGSNLSSRVVENLFWLGRYSERFDDSARLLRVALARVVDAGGEKTPAVASILELAERLGVLPSPEEDNEVVEGGEHALLEAIYDPNQPGSLAGSIRSLMWSATHVRERLSLDHWHSLNSLQREQQAAQKKHPTLTEAIAFLDRVLLVSSSLNGFAMDNMTRDDGWRFLIIGRRLERLSFLAQTIASFLRMPSTRAAGCLDWLLELADSIITYRSRYSRSPELLPVIDLLVFDDSNPHGVMFQADLLGRYLERMARELGADHDGQLSAATENLRSFNLEQLEHLQFSQCRHCAPCDELADRLEALNAAAGALSEWLAMRYFTHVGDVSRQTMAV
ncbi:MAG: circularly permuted type 2 ATP-grasp protein [Azonexaceae bacterium]|uniref:circularly permuted type 2 ATP-grasp protein n=1 Tax=Azonexus sp. R2A61 TaxID=2744443 RepID=UPI001F3D72D0|nr:circularly permuted type 2 ATP-grasp protein [Azonexus sp. R2A61]MCE1238297.1 circularly permuted type 2 ATP-grasp protein [Azonexaceae bacterium]